MWTRPPVTDRKTKTIRPYHHGFKIALNSGSVYTNSYDFPGKPFSTVPSNIDEMRVRANELQVSVSSRNI